MKEISLKDWLNALLENTPEFEKPTIKKSIQSAKEVTFHDFSTYYYVLDPWGDRTPLVVNEEDEDSQSNNSQSGSSNDQDSASNSDEWDPFEELSLSTFLINTIEVYLKEAQQASSDPENFDDQPIKELILIFITTCQNKLMLAYGMEKYVSDRLHQLVLSFLDTSIHFFVDQYSKMTSQQKIKFNKDLEKATQEWISRAYTFDAPWTVKDNRSPKEVRDESQWEKLKYVLKKGYQEVKCMRRDEWGILKLNSRNEFAHSIALNYSRAGRMGGSSMDKDCSILFEGNRGKPFTISFIPFSGMNSTGIETLSEIADKILTSSSESETELEIEHIDLSNWLDTLIDKLDKSLISLNDKSNKGLTTPNWSDWLDSLGSNGTSNNKNYNAAYGFQPYPANSINIGLQINYRQEWKPLGIAKGELVKTIPLGPGQSEKIKIHQSERLVRKVRTEDLVSTERSEESAIKTSNSSEVVEEAANSHNWLIKADGSFNVGIGPLQIGGTVQGPQYSGSTKDLSKQTKNKLAESMQKASSKIKRETKITVDTESEISFETTRTSEIKNPNDSMPVTYYYYNIQQQYEVYTYLASVEPVLFVAEKVVPPEKIDINFFRRYDWILSKALLDESFRDILGRISHTDIEEMRKEALLSIEEVENTYSALAAATSSLGQLNTLSGTVGSTYEATLVAYQSAVKSAKELGRELQSILSQTTRLANHIADNILHYHRAIWQREDPDRRRMRYNNYLWPTQFETNFDISGTKKTGVNQWDYLGYFKPVENSEKKPLSSFIDPSGPFAYAGNYSVFRLLKTEDTMGMSSLVRQTMFNYCKNPTFEVRGVDATVNVVNLDLLNGASYTIQFRGLPGLGPYSVTKHYMGKETSLSRDLVNLNNIEAQIILQLLGEGIEIIFKQLPDPMMKISVAPLPLELQDPEEKYLQLQNPDLPLEPDPERPGANSIMELLKSENTRIVYLDTDNLHLEIDPQPLLEPFKQYHRILDVAKVVAEIDRLNKRLETGNYSDPTVEKVIVVSDPEIGKLVGVNEALRKNKGSGK